MRKNQAQKGKVATRKSLMCEVFSVLLCQDPAEHPYLARFESKQQQNSYAIQRGTRLCQKVRRKIKKQDHKRRWWRVHEEKLKRLRKSSQEFQ